MIQYLIVSNRGVFRRNDSTVQGFSTRATRWLSQLKTPCWRWDVSFKHNFMDLYWKSQFLNIFILSAKFAAPFFCVGLPDVRLFTAPIIDTYIGRTQYFPPGRDKLTSQHTNIAKSSGGSRGGPWGHGPTLEPRRGPFWNLLPKEPLDCPKKWSVSFNKYFGALWKNSLTSWGTLWLWAHKGALWASEEALWAAQRGLLSS